MVPRAILGVKDKKKKSQPPSISLLSNGEGQIINTSELNMLDSNKCFQIKREERGCERE